MRKCSFCGRKLEKNWKYCPFCGERIEIGNIFNEVERIFEAFGFPKINITIKTEKDNSQMQVKKQKVRNVIEPETKIKEMDGYIKIIMKLPGVKKVSDIKIKKLSESIEVRAYTKDVMYFKVIPIKKETKILENKFVNELLKIVLTNSW